MQALDEIIEIVAEKLSKTLKDADGKRNTYHSESNTKSLDGTSNLLRMTTTLVVFPFSCNNTHFNEAKAGDQYTLKPHIVEIVDDFFEDDADLKAEST